MEKKLDSAGCSFFWDLLCAASVVGIWPRFIEPRLLSTTRLTFPFRLPGRSSFKILQVSDLHFHDRIPPSFLQKLQNRIAREKGDLIVLTGDFLCHGKLLNPALLKEFLSSLSAPFGIYAVLGNHDYTEWISINAKGDYDAIKKTPSPVKAGFRRLFSTLRPTKAVTDAARAVKPHPELSQILKDASISLLHNRSVNIGNLFNLTGLGEHMAAQAHPKTAFQNFDLSLPGVVLAHNPDAIPALKNYPGDLILSGHTHGGEVNLPLIWKRFTLLENPCYKGGLYQEEGKKIYVSRGVGGTFPFRLNALPELVSIELRHEI